MLWGRLGVAKRGLIRWEIPRLCRGGRKGLTNPGVCPSSRIVTLAMVARSGRSEPEARRAAALGTQHPAFVRLPTGPFEGPATGKPPALPEDRYTVSVAKRSAEPRKGGQAIAPGEARGLEARQREPCKGRQKAMANQYHSPLPGLNLMQTPTGGFSSGYFPAAPSGAPPEQFCDRNQIACSTVGLADGRDGLGTAGIAGVTPASSMRRQRFMSCSKAGAGETPSLPRESIVGNHPKPALTIGARAQQRSPPHRVSVRRRSGPA